METASDCSQLGELSRARPAASMSSPTELLRRAIGLRGEHRMTECLEYLQQALTIAPGSARVRYELACVHLQMRHYLAGFREYDSRWEAAGLPRPAHTDGAVLGPEWRGSDPAGKRILLHAEQGFGDTIQFIRYAPLVAKLGAQVVIEVHPELRELAACMELGGCRVGSGAPDGRYDLHCSLLDLPRAFGTTFDTIPPPVKFLPPDRVKRVWEERLGSSRRPKIALVWAGNPKNSSDGKRSMRLELLEPVLDAWPDAEFFSFQVGPASEQVRGYEGRVTDLQPYLVDFVETAVALLQMDRVITVDTAVAHLASSLGVKVWLLLSYTPCWRWLLEGTWSPWYPGMKLWRQKAAGDWASAITEMLEKCPSGPREHFE